MNLWEQYSTGQLNSHHPVAHTLLVGSIISFVSGLFDFNTGVAVYTVLQASVVALALSSIMCWMRMNDASPRLCIVLLLYCALNPVVSMYAMCATKDVLFSTFVILLCVVSYECASRSTRKSWILLISLVVLGLLVCIFRSNGLIAFVLMCPALVICVKRGCRFRVGLACMIALICSYIWLGPVSEALNVEESEAHRLDGMALPVQQLAAVCANGTLSDSEISPLEDLHYTDLQAYFPTLADPSRYTLKDMSTEEIIKAYLAIGLNHPCEYAEAFLLQTQAAWNPYSWVRTYNGQVEFYADHETSFFASNTASPAVSDSKLPALLNTLKSISLELDF